MRQRFLVGRYNYLKYAEKLGIQDSLTAPGSANMISTDVYRTIQSGYSELTGFLYKQSKQGNILNITQSQVTDLNTSGVGLPPFSISRKQKIVDDLGTAATSPGFVGIPITSSIIPAWDDDISEAACHFSNSARAVRGPLDSSYENIYPTKARLAPSYSKEFPPTT